MTWELDTQRATKAEIHRARLDVLISDTDNILMALYNDLQSEPKTLRRQQILSSIIIAMENLAIIRSNIG